MTMKPHATTFVLTSAMNSSMETIAPPAIVSLPLGWEMNTAICLKRVEVGSQGKMSVKMYFRPAANFFCNEPHASPR